MRSILTICKFSVRWLAAVSLLVLLAGCGGERIARPARTVHVADEIRTYTFMSGAEGWETYVTDGDQAVFRQEAQALVGAVVAESPYVLSRSGDRYNDIRVRVTVQQTEGVTGNGFGVVCRAGSDDDGYYFLISSSQRYSIQKSEDGRMTPLVDWTPSSALRSRSEPNELEIICAQNYLSLSANGTFLADVDDSAYSSGELAVALAAVEETAWVRFDDIFVHRVLGIGPR